MRNKKTEKRNSKKSRLKRMGKSDEKTKIDGETAGQSQKLLGEEQINEALKQEIQSKDIAESNKETPKEIDKDKNKSINQETNLSKGKNAYQKELLIRENQNTENFDVTLVKQLTTGMGTSCEEKYLRNPKNEEKIKTIPSAENIMNKINEKENGCKQKMHSKVNSEFIECTKPDYSLEFTKPPTYISKTFDVEDTVSQIKTNNKIPTMYKAQTLLYESQLRSSLPPYQRSSEGRTEMKDITKAVSESRNTLSEKRMGVARDSRRKPVFSTYLTDRTAVESSRVKLTCSILSASDPTITWYKNGSELDNKQKFRSKFVDGLITLEVLNAIPSDSGEYSCTIQTENGSITSSANLKVYPSFEASPIPPTFTRSIRDTYHLADNELVLECRIRGQPLPAITWLKNDEAIMLNERIQSHYLADGVCRLTISSPTSGDSGKYTCKAENSVWSDQISHDVYFAGAESCVCPRLGSIEKINLNRQAVESRRPHFTNVLTDYRVVSGGTIGLQVEIRGDPTRVEWLREGRSVTELYRNAQTYVDHDIYTLAVTDVTEKESGLYTCRAWSSHGNVDMNASITVVQPNLIEGKPATIVSRPAKDLLISVGEDINISFRVRGEPKPKVFFMKGIRDITNSLRVCKMTSDDYVKFTLKRSVIGDAGTYCIFARNAYGCDRAFVTVVVRQRASSNSLISDWMYPMDDLAISSVERNYKSVPDRIPSEPSVVDGGNNWISLAWSKPDSQTKAPILAYKIECWMLGKEGGARWTELGITPRNSFDAFNLKQGEEYHFRVTPRNRYGWGESVQTSAPIGIGLVGDRPEFTEILPGQLKVLLGESAVLGCSFKGNPTPEIVWMKNGHEIEEEKDRVTIIFDNLNTSLHINAVKIEDEGRYSCEASNVHGRSSTYARMAVITDRHIWEADAKLKRERSAGIDGEYPPQFTMRLRDRRVQATYPVRLTCQVVGNPPPILTWFKNGKEISSDGRHITSQDECFHTLEIAPTTLEDGGVYEVMARNCYGAISCRCSLVVDKGIRAYIAPEFCCGLEPLYHLSEGDELRISAVVEAYPSVGVTWYRDGVRLRPSRRAIMTLDRDGQIELALASVTGRDAGVYTCTASNEVGKASTSGKVEVVSEDNIVEKTSVPPIVISPDVPYSKEPLFIRKPRSSEAHEGDTVIIECEVIGDPKPDVYWLRDFLKPDYYRDASHFRRVGAGPAYRFEIPHAKFDYTGAYSIIAKNIHGEAKAIISLQILAKDPSAVDDSHNIRFGRVEVMPHIDKELTDLLCYDGDAVEFDCRVSGNPEPDIRWFHYSEIVPECPDFEASYDLGIARLKIKQVTAEDEGTYSCEASNSMGKVTSSACLVVYPPGEPNTLSQQLRRPTGLLSAASTPRSTPRTTPARSKSRTPGPDLRRLRSPTREIAPKFYTYPYNKVAEEGDTIVFQCAVKGLPPPWATWDKDGIIITPSARFNIKEKDETFKILEIEQVTIEDVGLYRITLENDYGRTEASARLEVITQKGKFYGTTRSYSVSPRKSLSYRRRTPSFSKQD